MKSVIEHNPIVLSCALFFSGLESEILVTLSPKCLQLKGISIFHPNSSGFFLLFIISKDAFLFSSFNLLKNPKNLFHRFNKQLEPSTGSVCYVTLQDRAGDIVPRASKLNVLDWQ